MTWTPLKPPVSKAPVGAYSYAARAGNHIFVSGHVPADPATGEIVGTSVREQTHVVLDRIDALLKTEGASLRDVVSITAYLADMADWDEFNRAYREKFQEPYPARTTVGAQLRGFLVEISAIAYLGT